MRERDQHFDQPKVFREFLRRHLRELLCEQLRRDLIIHLLLGELEIVRAIHLTDVHRCEVLRHQQASTPGRLLDR